MEKFHFEKFSTFLENQWKSFSKTHWFYERIFIDFPKKLWKKSKWNFSTIFFRSDFFILKHLPWTLQRNQLELLGVSVSETAYETKQWPPPSGSFSNHRLHITRGLVAKGGGGSCFKYLWCVSHSHPVAAAHWSFGRLQARYWINTLLRLWGELHHSTLWPSLGVFF